MFVNRPGLLMGPGRQYEIVAGQRKRCSLVKLPNRAASCIHRSRRLSFRLAFTRFERWRESNVYQCPARPSRSGSESNSLSASG